MIQDKRCVHLDFHTSEKIKGIGADFKREEFAAALKEANLDSITVFAKCHHGNLYYHSDKYFTHPHLTIPLLEEQLAACKEAGVSAKIYISAGFDEHSAMEHPEWLQVTSDGTHPNLLMPGFKRLCFNTPYLDVLVGQTEEIMEKYNPDGVFYDIVAEGPCTCRWCMRDMAKKGLDYRKYEDLMKQARDVFMKFTETLTGTVRRYHKDTLVFYNAGNFPVGAQYRLNCCDQLEAESLPTGGWGYDHFPMTMSYIRRNGKNCIGMTGKFHRSWGDMGTYKYKDALLYEGAQCLAFDAGLSVGDSLHPGGRVDFYTYENIGNTMRYLEERTPWRGGEFLPEFAVLGEGASRGVQGRIGASRMFFEKKYLFDIIDNAEISNRYPLIVLPNDAALTDAAYKALTDYVANGGKILAVGQAPMYRGQMAFDLGAEMIGPDELTPTFFRSRYALEAASGMTMFVENATYDIRATGEVLADKLSPYFKREGLNFSGHSHTSADFSKVSPAITMGKHGIYVSSCVFAEYAKSGSLNDKQLVLPLMEMLLGKENKTVETNLPSNGKVTLYKKGDSYILHLLYANTVKRGENIEVIEDLATLADINVSLKLPENVTRAICRPSGKEIALTKDENGRISFTLERFRCHEIIELI